MKSGRFTPSAYAYAYAATTVLNAVHSGQTFFNGPPYPPRLYRRHRPRPWAADKGRQDARCGAADDALRVGLRRGRKAAMKIGQKVTNSMPDFQSERWVGLEGEIVAHPFLPICGCQIDIKCNSAMLLAAMRMRGFH